MCGEAPMPRSERAAIRQLAAQSTGAISAAHNLPRDEDKGQNEGKS
jgi:hypothetical protein